MGIELLPEFIRDNYEVHEWKHACAILKEDFVNEWNDIVSVLESFRLKKSWITTPGGRKSKISGFMMGIFIIRDWIEKRICNQSKLWMTIQWIHQLIKLTVLKNRVAT